MLTTIGADVMRLLSLSQNHRAADFPDGRLDVSTKGNAKNCVVAVFQRDSSFHIRSEYSRTY